MTPRAEAWIRQATSDLKAGRCMESEGFHAQACYHAGQAAEKALKGLLVACGVVPPHSHSLDRRLEAIADQGRDTSTLKALPLKALTCMNSETRYPQDAEAPVDRFDAHDSDQALSLASSVLCFSAARLREGEGGASASGL